MGMDMVNIRCVAVGMRQFFMGVQMTVFSGYRFIMHMMVVSVGMAVSMLMGYRRVSKDVLMFLR